MARHDRTLYRDEDDRKLGGVCSGLAHYFDLDPLLVRVAFVAALTFGGASLVAYLLLWWLLDPAPAGTWDEQAGGAPDAAPSTATSTETFTNEAGSDGARNDTAEGHAA